MSIVCISKIPRNTIKLYYWYYHDIWYNDVTSYDVYTYTQVLCWHYDVWQYNSPDDGTTWEWQYVDYVYGEKEKPPEESIYGGDLFPDNPSEGQVVYKEVVNSVELEITPTGDSGQAIYDHIEYNGEWYYLAWGSQVRDGYVGGGGVIVPWDAKDDFFLGDPTIDENGIMFRRTKTETVNKPADYPLGIVASENPNAYPDNAEQGAYWYIKRE